ncbi:class I SAM-dependent methyltransferase [Rhodococcus marinonascens]|uniref:class I SAM-dependent methyltransferase n=1 Tax=Rhodococcus marinonascens TaxID=38311 RepID=UPI000932AF6F|nr:class I SAM-dependent methyltransferase [Rhodococcus marinonascens]
MIPSPNIWHWPDVYEVENRAQDVDGAIFRYLRATFDWTGNTVVDVGCGSGFHLPVFAESAQTVIGVEPHTPLLNLARQRVADMRNVRVMDASAERIPLGDASVDLVHARTAYFFGPGCGPGIAEALRVLRPGGALVVVDLDATAHPYGTWMCSDLPQYRSGPVETFFAAQGFDLVRVETRWAFSDRESLRGVLNIEFTKRTAARAFARTPGLSLDVRYRIHARRKPAVLETL